MITTNQKLPSVQNSTIIIFLTILGCKTTNAHLKDIPSMCVDGYVIIPKPDSLLLEDLLLPGYVLFSPMGEFNQRRILKNGLFLFDATTTLVSPSHSDSLISNLPIFAFIFDNHSFLDSIILENGEKRTFYKVRASLVYKEKNGPFPRIDFINFNYLPTEKRSYRASYRVKEYEVSYMHLKDSFDYHIMDSIYNRYGN